ncbi:hypothetical protein NEOKW01_1605 [Nematocida sp. AWRm80]|nr:hypothetical protein NEOKW01_1605 [Nematocida sp. AWRm80]
MLIYIPVTGGYISNLNLNLNIDNNIKNKLIIRINGILKIINKNRNKICSGINREIEKYLEESRESLEESGIEIFHPKERGYEGIDISIKIKV